jgi:hypothetical protein
VRATLSNGESPSPFLSSSSTPTDSRLKLPRTKVLLAVFLITIAILSVALVFQFVPSVQAVSEYENFDTITQSGANVYGVNWAAEVFAVGATSHTVTSIRINIGVQGAPGTSNVSIRATSGGLPTGNDLTSATFSPAAGWNNISVTEYTLLASTSYAIVVRAPSGSSFNKVTWNGHTAGEDGSAKSSTDSGATWAVITFTKFSYEIWGNSVGGTYPPTYTTIGSNETIAGNPVNCYVLWAANGTAISGFIFSTDNGSAAYTNQTWSSSMTGGWGNYTFTLNVTVGTAVHWKEYCNNTANDWNTTSVQTITTTLYQSISITTSTHTWTISPGQNNVTINENSGKIAFTVTSNAAFDVGAKADGDLTYAGYSISLTNTNMSATTWSAAIPLTTSYQTVPGLSNVGSGTGLSENVYLWLSCPTNKPAGAYTETITFEIIQHGGSY